MGLIADLFKTKIRFLVFLFLLGGLLYFFLSINGRIGSSESDNNTFFIDIATGTAHTLAIDSEGKLYGVNFGDRPVFSHIAPVYSIDGNRNASKPIIIPDLSPSAKIVFIAVGHYYSFVIDSEGKVWTTGSNHYGQLGLGNNIDQSSFEPVTFSALPSTAKIVSIATGDYHSLALDSYGRVWASGDNKYGQLGLGNNINQNLFQLVTLPATPTNTKIVSIAADGYHSLALDSNGGVWAAGFNRDKQLGLDDTSEQSWFKPVTISGLPISAKIISIAAGDRHSLALDSEGKLWAAGDNLDGALGLGNDIRQSLFRPVVISGSPYIVSIAISGSYSLALDSDGQIWASGDNLNGQLGLGNNLDQYSFKLVTIPDLSPNAKIVSISAGTFHSFALDSYGKIWATEFEYDIFFALSSSSHRYVFEPLPSNSSLAELNATR